MRLPKILKILGKSVLCFIGLAAAGWGVQKLTDIFFFMLGSFFFMMLKLTILQYIFWFLLYIGYVYILFSVFKNEKRRRLIMMLNGAAVFLQFYIPLFLTKDRDILFLSVQLSNLFGIPVIALALMLNSIAPDKKKHINDKPGNKAAKGLKVLLKSFLCFLALVIIIKVYGLFFRQAVSILGYVGFFIENFYLMWCLMAIGYAYALYKLVQKHAYRHLILILNAALLMVAWGMIFIPDIELPIDRFLLSAVCGNTALITIILAFVFRSVEKHGNMENSLV